MNLPQSSYSKEIDGDNLPSMWDLPFENKEEGLPDYFHSQQGQLLGDTFIPRNVPPSQIFSGIDMYLYYDQNHTLWYKRPDWFGVVGVSSLYQGEMRLSYVMWKEKIIPHIIVELLSPGTEDEDLGKTKFVPDKSPPKWVVYEQILQVPYYVVYSRYTEEMQAFQLIGGKYEKATLIEGRLPIVELGLSLGVYRCEYKGIEMQWLRWFTIEGQLIPTPQETALESQKTALFAQKQALESQLLVTEVRSEFAQTQAELIQVQQRAETAEIRAETAEIQLNEAEIRVNETQIQLNETQAQLTEAEMRAAEAEQKLQLLAAQLQALGINPQQILGN